MSEQAFAAVDLGASSGRVLAGAFDGRRLRLEEVHRFENGPVAVGQRRYWDLLRLWSEVQGGLRRAGQMLPGQIVSVGVDTWGVDFGLLGRGELLGHPVHYRDPWTDGAMERAFAEVPRAEIFASTGLQFMQFNTLYQLLALRDSGSPLWNVADRLLMMPDLFHWLLTGEASNEFTNATTTQCFDPRAGNWASGLLRRFGIPEQLFGPVQQPGTTLGPLTSSVAAETGLKGVKVVLPGTHDTASAVMAVPAASTSGDGPPDWCYISAGTWALMGVESRVPIVNERCQALNFTNEGGVGGTYRVLKNIAGLWLVQECRRIWSQGGDAANWEALSQLAAEAKPRTSFVDPDAAVFMAPADMPRALAEYCQQTGQAVPADRGTTLRVALESIALKCRRVLGWLEELVGRRIETIHLVGGGVQNQQLCQWTADACRRRVVAGPVEATAIGNAMMQAVAAGAVGSVSEARDVIRQSFPVVEYVPREGDAWDEAYERFLKLPGV